MELKTVESVKREAKAIARSGTLSHSQALDMLAQKEGLSHWGAYQAGLVDLEARSATRAGRTISLLDVLHDMLPDLPLTQEVPAGVRHLVVSGGTGTGKTSLLQRLLLHVPTRAPIVVLDEQGELTNPNPHDPPRDFTGIHDALGYSVGPYMYAAFGEEAYRMPYLRTCGTAGVLAFGEIDQHNRAVVRQAMSDRDGPAVFATVHGVSPAAAAERLAYDEDGAYVYPRGEVLCIHLARDEAGGRRIAEVTVI